MNATIRAVAERAAGEVYELVQAAAEEAARDAVRKVLAELVGGMPIPDVDVQDRVTRTEAARKLGVTPQRIIRLEKKGAVESERTEDGRVFVRLSQVAAALAASGRVEAATRIARSA